jgi:hypothetical protein
MAINTRGTVDKSSPFHPSGAKRTDSLASGRPATTQHVMSFVLRSSERFVRNGPIGVFSAVCHDADGPHYNEFREFDPLFRQAVEHLQPIERGKRYDVDFDITWKHTDGWPTVQSYKEWPMGSEPPGKGKENMTPSDVNEQVADPTELNEALGRTKDDKPTKRPSVPSGAAPYIRNHVKKHYTVEGKELNEQLKVIFMGQEPEQYIRANGVDAAYRVMDAYDAGKLAANAAQTFVEPQSDQAASTPPDANNGHLEVTQGKDSDVSQPTKPVPQSEPKTGITDLSEKRDEIRSKYTLDMRGKDYLTVQGRVLLFRLEHADWTLDTDVIAITDLIAVFKATIKNAEGRVIASGHGRATEAGTKNLGGRFVEKAETAAIGRALALAGYGTDDSLDDSDYLSDSPVAKAA